MAEMFRSRWAIPASIQAWTQPSGRATSTLKFLAGRSPDSFNSSGGRDTESTHSEPIWAPVTWSCGANEDLAHRGLTQGADRWSTASVSRGVRHGTETLWRTQ